MNLTTTKGTLKFSVLAGGALLLIGLLTGCNGVGNQKIYAHQVFTEALAYESLSNYSRSLELYREVVDEYSETNRSMAARAQIRMARIYKNDLNNDSEALKAFKKYVENYPEEPDHQEVVLELARLYEESNEINNAIDTFDTFVERYSSSPYRQEALYKMGELYLKESKPWKAIEQFNQVISDFPEGEQADDSYIKRAQAFEELDKPEKEMSSYKTLIERFPDSEHAEFAMFQVVKIASSLERTDTVNEWVERYRTTYPNGEYTSKINVLEPGGTEGNNGQG